MAIWGAGPWVSCICGTKWPAIVAGALLSLIFLFPTFALLFFYDTLLGWLGLGLGLISLGVTLYVGLRQMPHYRRLLAVSRRLTGVLLQLIGGVAKLRVSGAEASAFAMWASNYREQKHAEMQLGTLNEHLIAFTSAAPFFAVAALFAAALHRSEYGLAVGSFLAVYAAFMVFYGAVAQFGLSFSCHCCYPAYRGTGGTHPDRAPQEGGRQISRCWTCRANCALTT